MKRTRKQVGVQRGRAECTQVDLDGEHQGNGGIASSRVHSNVTFVLDGE
jgi:hypothetical protein